MSEEVNTPEVPNETAAPQEPQISLADFSAALQVIDVCTTRGAFRGEELSSVGQLRDRPRLLSIIMHQLMSLKQKKLQQKKLHLLSKH